MLLRRNSKNGADCYKNLIKKNRKVQRNPVNLPSFNQNIRERQMDNRNAGLIQMKPKPRRKLAGEWET